MKGYRKLLSIVLALCVLASAAALQAEAWDGTVFSAVREVTTPPEEPTAPPTTAPTTPPTTEPTAPPTTPPTTEPTTPPTTEPTQEPVPVPAKPLYKDDEDYVFTTVEEALALAFERYRFSEQNFAMGYYNTYTGELWFYNEDYMMSAGSVYKLPLNMLYEDMLNAGELEEDSLVGGYRLKNAMYMSLVESNNEASETIMHVNWTYEEFRKEITKYDQCPEELLTREVLRMNEFCPRYTMNIVQYLYDNSEQYPVVLGHLKAAQPGRYFKAFVDDVEIAQKYGYYEGYLAGAAIVYTEQPFMMVVFTNTGLNSALGDICKAMYIYTEQSNAAYVPPTATPEPTPTPVLTATPGAVPTPVPTAVAAPEKTGPDAGAMGPLYVVMLSLSVLVLAGALLSGRRGGRR